MTTCQRFFSIIAAALLAVTTQAQTGRPVVVIDSTTVAALLAAEPQEDDTVFVEEYIPVREASHSWKERISDDLDDLMKSDLLETSVAAVSVWDLTDDVALYDFNKRQRLRPASTLKTLTAIAAIDELGSDYLLSTKLYATGMVSDTTLTTPDDTQTYTVSRRVSLDIREENDRRVLHGDLYVVGGMDPKLDTADIDAFARSIVALGVDSIAGTLYADQSFKDDKRLGAGWCWDDDDSNPLLLPLTYQDRDVFTLQLANWLRTKYNIYVRAAAIDAVLPVNAVLLCARARALRSVMLPMLKSSDNGCAESVFYQMIHHRYGNGATASQGDRMIRDLMARSGITDTLPYDIADGSGLSLYNYVTTEMEVQLLRYAWKHPEIYHTIYPLLPIAGVDGTLRRRMIGTAAYGNVHAKTGTVTGIRALCGYCTASNGHKLAFAIINQGVSGSNDEAKRARSMQDKICETLCQ